MATIDFSRGDEFCIGDDLLHVRRSDDDDLGVSIDYGDALTINFDFAQSMQIMDALLALNEMVDVEKIVVNSFYTPVDVWCAMREHTHGTVNGCLFAAEVAAARGRRKKEIAASALLDAVAEKLKGKKEEAT